MTRSSTKELFTPLKDPEREFRSSRKHFKTLSLDESRSPDFESISDKRIFRGRSYGNNGGNYKSLPHVLTGADVLAKRLTSGAITTWEVLRQRPECSTETLDGLAAIQAQLNNLGREIKKVNEKVYAAQVGYGQCKGPHYTKDCRLKEEGKTLEEAYYTQFGAPFQGGGYRATAPGFYQRNNANPSQISKSISTTIEADASSIRRIGSHQYVISIGQNNTLMYETRQTTIPSLSRLNDCDCEEKKEKDLGSFTLSCYINNVCFDNVLADFGASVSVMPLLTYLNLGLGELAHTKLTVELANRTVKYPEDVKVPLILERPFLSTAHAKIDVFKRKITLRVGDEKIIFKSIKLASSLIKRVYMLSLREIMKLDLEARLMGETLVLNRSLDPLYGDYIELNDLNVPLELRRDQVDDLMPTIEEGEVIDKPMIDIIKTRNNESFNEYPSFCDFDRKIHIDCAYNLRFSCMIGRYGVSVPALTKDHKGKKLNKPYSEEVNTSY
ncbi:hypothetical protein Tco_0299585 [Tanacetum coccineum]